MIILGQLRHVYNSLKKYPKGYHSIQSTKCHATHARGTMDGTKSSTRTLQTYGYPDIIQWLQLTMAEFLENNQMIPLALWLQDLLLEVKL